MGVDILDLTFRLERRFGIKIRRDDLVKLIEKNEPPDVTVGQLFDFVRSRADRVALLDDEMDADLIWLMFQREVSDALGVEPGEVLKGSWIIRDLGAT
jgi:hypothetical protein